MRRFSVRFDAQRHASGVECFDQRIHDPQCPRETRLAYRNSQCRPLRYWLIAKIPTLRFSESTFGRGDQCMRSIERFGDHNPILGLCFELASDDEMLRIGLNGFIADVALPDDLCRAGIFGKRRSREFFSCGDLGPIAQRRQRYCEFSADLSECDVRYAVAFRNRGDCFYLGFFV